MGRKSYKVSIVKKMLPLLLPLVLLLVGFIVFETRFGVKKQASAQENSSIHTFVLVGQSNMVGQGTVPLTQSASPNILKWDNLKWIVGFEPIHNDGFGPGMSFAIELLTLKNDKNYKIGIIPCAKNATSITEWQKGQVLYEDCLVKVKAAQANGAVIEGMLMSQGERDTYTKASADAWGQLVLDFARDFRTDYGNLQTPFVFAQLGSNPQNPTYPRWNYLHNLQPNILPGHDNIKMVTTDDLAKNSDKIHFNRGSQITIGRRFARALCKVMICE